MLEPEIEPLGGYSEDDREPTRRERVLYHPLAILMLAILGTVAGVLVSRALGI